MNHHGAMGDLHAYPFPFHANSALSSAISAAPRFAEIIFDASALKIQMDRNPESWEAGFMKTTLDLPEDLVREMKFRAVRQGRKLRDVAEEVFRRGLAAPSAASSSGGRHRVELPLIPAPAGAKSFEINGERLLELEMEAESRGGQP